MNVIPITDLTLYQSFSVGFRGQSGDLLLYRLPIARRPAKFKGTYRENIVAVLEERFEVEYFASLELFASDEPTLGFAIIAEVRPLKLDVQLLRDIAGLVLINLFRIDPLEVDIAGFAPGDYVEQVETFGYAEYVLDKINLRDEPTP